MKPTFSAIVDPQETPVPSTHDYSLLINRQPRNKTLAQQPYTSSQDYLELLEIA